MSTTTIVVTWLPLLINQLSEPGDTSLYDSASQMDDFPIQKQFGDGWGYLQRPSRLTRWHFQWEQHPVLGVDTMHGQLQISNKFLGTMDLGDDSGKNKHGWKKCCIWQKD